MEDLTFRIEEDNTVLVLVDGKEVYRVQFPEDLTQEELKDIVEEFVSTIRVQKKNKRKYFLQAFKQYGSK